MPLSRATWLTAEKSRCFTGSLPNFSKWPNFGLGWPSALRRATRGFDHQRHVVGVAVDRYAAFDDCQGQSLGLQVAIVGADDRRELGTRGMAHHDESFGIAAELGDVVVNPVNRLRDVADDGLHVDVGQEPVVRRDEDDTLCPRRPSAWRARSSCHPLASRRRESRRPRASFSRFQARRRRASDVRSRARRTGCCV